MRVRTTDLSTEKRVAAVRDFSTPIAAEMGTADRAVMDAAQLKGGIFASYKGGDMKSDGNREFVRQFIEAAIPANERKSFTTDTGKIDSSGMARIEGAVIAHAYESKDMVNFLKAEADPVTKVDQECANADCAGVVANEGARKGHRSQGGHHPKHHRCGHFDPPLNRNWNYVEGHLFSADPPGC